MSCATDGRSRDERVRRDERQLRARAAARAADAGAAGRDPGVLRADLRERARRVLQGAGRHARAPSATAISAGWAAAFLSGTLAFFQVSSSRGADRRLAAAGLGAWRVALSRIAAALVLGVTVSAVAFVTLWLRSGIGHPLHAAVAIFAFAAIYIGIGALIGAFVSAPAGGIAAGHARVLARRVLRAADDERRRDRRFFTPTRHAANLLIAAGGGQGSPGADWLGVAASRSARWRSRWRRSGWRRARGPDAMSRARSRRPRWRSATSGAGRWC